MINLFFWFFKNAADAHVRGQITYCLLGCNLAVSSYIQEFKGIFFLFSFFLSFFFGGENCGFMIQEDYLLNCFWIWSFEKMFTI